MARETNGLARYILLTMDASGLPASRWTTQPDPKRAISLRTIMRDPLLKAIKVAMNMRGLTGPDSDFQWGASMRLMGCPIMIGATKSPLVAGRTAPSRW
jgi:hypothetical protein